uniref:Src homology 2 domain containing transforming protein D n=1 Tax=Accipiter nisus TaxID=211598 RepID=A0A8B9NLV3_9AVES
MEGGWGEGLGVPQGTGNGELGRAEGLGGAPGGGGGHLGSLGGGLGVAESPGEGEGVGGQRDRVGGSGEGAGDTRIGDLGEPAGSRGGHPGTGDPGGGGQLGCHPSPGTHPQGPGESEYSEPFEGEQDPAPEGGCEEPGEATGGPRRGPQLYDTPYEEWETAGEGPGVPTTRESRLPRDDERPADEYDQPWEWKKDHISRAFAGDGIPGRWMGPGDPVLCGGVPRCRTPGWYHGPIGRAGAETLLALCREGSFLVRDCETSPDDYSLSLRSSHGFVHVKLTRTREQHFMLGRAGAAFPSVPEAVRHYTARALPVRGARHLSLLYPVAVQPL